MRLINTSTLLLEEFSGSEIPPYAILSHTWGADGDEIIFEEMTPSISTSSTAQKPGFEKIRKTCDIAREQLSGHKLQYAWVDTCCINKASSAELSEAINSMFKWYKDSSVCFVHLSDVESGSQMSGLQSRWFRRGWTLQELIAPKDVVFYDKRWNYIGTKQTLADELTLASGIDRGVLMNEATLVDFPVAVRMSWAASRVTKREEDVAYSLLGIFDVNMPMLYGEGPKAFQRLQEEIIKENPDMSIFAWTSDEPTQTYTGLFAQSPANFRDEGKLLRGSDYSAEAREFSVTNRGVKFQTELPFDDRSGCFVLPLDHYSTGMAMGVSLRRVGPDLFVRTGLQALPNAPIIYQTPFHVAKRIPSQQAAEIDAYALHVREPDDLSHPDFRLLRVEPRGSWSPAKRLLYAGTFGSFVGYLQFAPTWTDTYDSFVLVCSFYTTRHVSEWRFQLVSGDDWRIWQQGYQTLFKPNSKVVAALKREDEIRLPHLFDDTKAKVVSIRADVPAPGESCVRSIELIVKDAE